MTVSERLVNQHIMEHESRLKHIDELIDKAHQGSSVLEEGHALKAELGQYRDQRSTLAEKTEELKAMPTEHWREEMIKSAGPMGIWDILAQKLENLVERIG